MNTTNISIGDVLGQLYARKNHFDLLIKSSTSEEDSFLYLIEQAKINELIVEIENNKEEKTKDLQLQNAFLNIQIQYEKAKNKIVKSITSLQTIETEDITHYNNLMYKYNLFVNVLESVI